MSQQMFKILKKVCFVSKGIKKDLLYHAFMVGVCSVYGKEIKAESINVSLYILATLLPI